MKIIAVSWLIDENKMVKELRSTERNRKYVAHDEKSKFSVFRPEIPYGSSRNVVAFFVEKLFLNLQKI